MMADLLNELDEVLLMGAGPSCVPPSVLKALSRSTVGLLDPCFLNIMDDLQVKLRQLMRTSNKLTFPISGTGSAGMETCFVNLIEHGDEVLVLSNGFFGMRMAELASRLGGNVQLLEFEWGKPVEVATVQEHLSANSYKIVAVIHAETSTGVCNNVADIGKAVKRSGALYLVDSVTGLGGIDVQVDGWGIDAFYSGSQKCLSCPPGLSPVSFSSNALEALGRRKSKVPNWYLDISLLGNYWTENEKRVYHHTPPVNMVYALYEAVRLVLQDGLDRGFKRHLDCHRQLLTGLEELGLVPFVEAPFRLPMLNTVRVPEGVNDLKFRRILRENYKIEIAGGLGQLSGRIWRIGLMGHSARRENVERLLRSMRDALKMAK